MNVDSGKLKLLFGNLNVIQMISNQIKRNEHFQASSHSVSCKTDSKFSSYFVRSWLIVFASFMINGVIFGIINSFGVIYVHLLHLFKDVNDAAFLTALVGSGFVGTTFFCSPISSIVTNRFGIRITTFVGGLLATIGMFLSSFCISIYYLYFTYAFMIGLGSSLCYSPSLVILGHYFKKKLGFVNGIVTSGSSAFTVIIPIILRNFLQNNSIFVAMRWLSCLLALLMLCSLTFKEKTNQKTLNLSKIDLKSNSKKLKVVILEDLIKSDIWRNKRYTIWVIAFPVALFGYFVPGFHLVKHVNDILPLSNGELLVTTIGATSGIGRLIFGKIADIKCVNSIALQQIALLFMGSLTIMYSFASQYTSLLIISAIFGIFDGCFVSLLGHIAYSLVGKEGASQAIGFVLGFSSIPFIIGPAVAGYLYDVQGNYFYTFIFAGIPFFIGALMMIPIIESSKSTDLVKQENSNLLNRKQNGFHGLTNNKNVENYDSLLEKKKFSTV